MAASITRGEYCASKAGLSMASTLFALRLADHGIGVYEIQSGLIATEMTALSKARYDAQTDAGLTAIRRWGQPEEVARVLATLVRDGRPADPGRRRATHRQVLRPQSCSRSSFPLPTGASRTIASPAIRCGF